MDKPHVFDASDYAGLRVKDDHGVELDVYYGYEMIFCPNHHELGLQESTYCRFDEASQEGCDEDKEWCFVAKVSDETVAWYPTSQLEPYTKNTGVNAQYVLAGLALMYQSGLLAVEDK